MIRILTVILLSVVAAGFAFEAVADTEQESTPTLLREGFVFSGVDGTVKKAPDEEKWDFISE